MRGALRPQNLESMDSFVGSVGSGAKFELCCMRFGLVDVELGVVSFDQWEYDGVGKQKGNQELASGIGLLTLLYCGY